MGCGKRVVRGLRKEWREREKTIRVAGSQFIEKNGSTFRGPWKQAEGSTNPDR